MEGRILPFLALGILSTSIAPYFMVEQSSHVLNHLQILLIVLFVVVFLEYYVIYFFVSPFYSNKKFEEVEKEVENGRFKNHFGGYKRYGNIPPVYPNGWFKLMESSDLPSDQARYVSALGQNFAIFRGKDGKAKIIDAYCPHLGANLGIGGIVKDGNVECPFHGWQFDGDGICQKIPYSENVPKFAKTKAWPTFEANGLICVWFDAEGREPHWYPPVIDAIENGSYKYHGRTQNIIRAHIQEIPENGADTAHLNVLHTRAIWVPVILDHKWQASWAPGEGEEEYASTMVVKAWVYLFRRFYIPLSYHEAHIRQYGPGVVYLEFDTIFGKVWSFETVTPYGPLLQNAEHTLWAAPSVPRLYATIMLRNLIGQFQRDVPIWSNKTYLDKPMIIKEDGNISQFRRWYSKFYSTNSPTLQSLQASSLDW